MTTSSPVEWILIPDALSDEDALRLLEPVEFREPEVALERLRQLCPDDPQCGTPHPCRDTLASCLRMLLSTLTTVAQPDASLINFERYLQSVPDKPTLLEYLRDNPRAVEILIRLFVGSQYLTEILLRNPDYLKKLVAHKRLADFKSRIQFEEEQREAAEHAENFQDRFQAYRRIQQWELLRIGACDAFGLMDLKSVTTQLSLLADSLVRNILRDIASEEDRDLDNFVVIAMGKLGGEELNYSSDIDLIFLTRTDAGSYWKLGQKLIKALIEATSEGFLYRTDMRLRPWGNSGALVNTVEAHVKYLEKHGMLWEFQALLKARPIAGNFAIAAEFLDRVEPLMYGTPEAKLRENIRETKAKIESKLTKVGKNWGEVKSGPGSIRDIEFVLQFLQLLHGGKNRYIRSIGTLDGLLRLADVELLPATEYRELSSGYVFLRTIEHALQLMHHKQVHAMPEDPRELAFLARRLDYPDGETFLNRYETHRRAIRRIFDRYFAGTIEAPPESKPPTPEQIFRNAPDYAAMFTEQQLYEHGQILAELSDEAPVRVRPERLSSDANGEIWRVTVGGYDHSGDLSMICGLLFVYGFDILDGQVFTGEHVPGRQVSAVPGQPTPVTAGQFIDVFTVQNDEPVDDDDFWQRYESDLQSLITTMRSGREREAQGELAKRVGAFVQCSEPTTETLYPVEIDIDNDSSDRFTLLYIHTTDTPGFLYELANALALVGVDVSRVVIGTDGTRISDVLYVTDSERRKIVEDSRQKALRTAVVLIKQFTHLLPISPNPESALLNFREFLGQLLDRENWVEELSRIDRGDVLNNLARLLGVSNFLWEDFLKVQHNHLFPFVTDVDRIALPKLKEALQAELDAKLAKCDTLQDCRTALNAFKDQEMFRIDMRNILDQITKFGSFSAELSDLAEVVVRTALRLCFDDLVKRYGTPKKGDGSPVEHCMAALGKCGGRELGFASDIELMLLYDGHGTTDGPESITTAEFFPRLVDCFTKTISARRAGIFEIDLRLRPYGQAGAAAVTLETFEDYFKLGGPAWPYERQALVKLRPIAGPKPFEDRVVKLRDDLIYRREVFDPVAMRAMREKQVRQLVKGGTFNAKLSPGGLVEIEYFVQAMQIRHGQGFPALRATNTMTAIGVLKSLGLISGDDAERLTEAYIFLRRLIDALRVVRGHAKDLTVPEFGTEGFLFLARRLSYRSPEALRDELDRCIETVTDLVGRLLPQV